MQDEIVEIYEKEEDITLVVERLKHFSFDDIKKTDHFYYSIEEKGTNMQLLKEKFTEFDRIKLIVKRKHRTSGKISYDFYYALEDETYLMYALALDEKHPVFINAFHVNRNFRHFKKSLMNAYKKDII